MSDVKNGLYSIQIQMIDGDRRGHATGVLVLLNGNILGGDTNFYYTGSYTFKDGKWRGELTTRQHAEAIGVRLLFGGREVTSGFTGIYFHDAAEVNGTALVGKTSVSFTAKLALKSAL
jgi:T3SS negative regulator,GrlR